MYQCTGAVGHRDLPMFSYVQTNAIIMLFSRIITLPRCAYEGFHIVFTKMSKSECASQSPMFVFYSLFLNK